MAYKRVCVDNKFSEPVVIYRDENTPYNFIKIMHEEFGVCKKVMKKLTFYQKNWPRLRKKKTISDQVTHAGYVKNWLIMIKK